MAGAIFCLCAYFLFFSFFSVWGKTTAFTAVMATHVEVPLVGQDIPNFHEYLISVLYIQMTYIMCRFEFTKRFRSDMCIFEFTKLVCLCK